MRTLVTGIWKEWRDARGIAIALLVALPVLAFTAAFAFGGEVPKPSFGGLSLFVITVAQALYVLAVASESFGGERRRGTLDFLRRLPRGLGRAFLAKCATYVLGSVVACAWGVFVTWTVCAAVGPERAVPDFATLLLQPDPLTVTLALSLFVLGLWTLFVSNLVPQGGAATVGAALLLGLLGVPVFLALKDRPWLVELPDAGTQRLGLAALGAVGAAALVFAFLRGCRFLGGVWAPAWRGLSVILVLAGGGYAWGAVELDRALTLDPSDPEFRVGEAYVGTGGRYLFLNVYRGQNAWHPSLASGATACTPVQPWIVDLTDGSHRVAGEYQQAWGPFVWNSVQMPQPILRRYDPTVMEIAWFDGATGALRKVLPHDVVTKDVLAWQRASMPALAWHKDAEGRALWLEGSRIQREGAEPSADPRDRNQTELWSYPQLPDGWLCARVVLDEAHKARNQRVTVEAATGTERVVPDAGGWHNEIFLSCRTVLRRVYAKVPRGQKAPLLPWTLVDLDHDGAVLPTVNPPDMEWLIAALPGERTLVMAGPDPKRRVLSSWDPRTGETTPILDADGEPTYGRYTGMFASAPGLRVVQVVEDTPYMTAAPATQLLMDDALDHAWRLPFRERFSQVICIEGPRSVIVKHGRSEILRHTLVKAPNRAHDVFTAETLFPR